MKILLLALSVCFVYALDSLPRESTQLHISKMQSLDAQSPSFMRLQTTLGSTNFPLILKDFWFQTPFKTPAKSHIFLSFCEEIAMLDLWHDALGLSQHVFKEPLLRLSNPRIDSLPAVGGGSGSSINPETLKTLNPDVVIVWAGDKRLVEFSRKLGVAILAFYPQNIDELFVNMGQIAQVFDKQDLFLQKARYALALLDSLQKPPKDSQKKVIYVWDKLTRIAGNTGMVGDMLERVGVQSMGASVALDSYEVSLESLINFNPEVIFLWGGSPLAEKDLYDNPQLQNLKAIQQRQVYKLPKWDNWGVRITQTALLVSALSYPKMYDYKEVKTQIQTLNATLFGLQDFPERIELLERVRNAPQ
ncbi:ABC transporter substrate-binding protein [uncultured Helicobacter sp.]|uniref:ABC transporter substrate-binding protein n=1 Tax=uncultured Helicobacter sp. TaxID=175537 RepID=UPI00374EEC28